MHADLNSVRQAFQRELNGFLLVFPVPVQDGVRHGFPHRHVNSKSCFFTDAGATYEFCDCGGGGFNGVNAARKTDFGRL
jgi:hypothetical protein